MQTSAEVTSIVLPSSPATDIPGIRFGLNFRLSLFHLLLLTFFLCALRHLQRNWSYVSLNSCHYCFVRLSPLGHCSFSCAKLAPTSSGKYR